MILEAIVWKWGQLEGLSLVDDHIVEWPYASEKPSEERLAEVVAEYSEHLKHAEKVKEERSWRDTELARADIELAKAQDGMGTKTVSEWRAYRCRLRRYPESVGFPYGERPLAP